jgi:hypothetical protein
MPSTVEALDFLRDQEALFITGGCLQTHDFFSGRLTAKTSLL